MKLFLVKLGYPLGRHYVVAKDPTAAYQKIRKEYDKKDYGFRKDREMKSISLIADVDEFGECGTRLWI